MLRKLKERLSAARFWRRQEKQQRRRTIHFEMMERRILPSAGVIVAPQAPPPSGVQAQQLMAAAAITTAIDTQVLKDAQQAAQSAQYAQQPPAVQAASTQPQQATLAANDSSAAIATSQSIPTAAIAAGPSANATAPVTTPAGSAEAVSASSVQEQVSTTAAVAQSQGQAMVQQTVTQIIFIDPSVQNYAAIIDQIKLQFASENASQSAQVQQAPAPDTATTGSAPAQSNNSGLQPVALANAQQPSGSSSSSNVSSDDQFKIVVLDPNEDGIEQITETLKLYKDISAVHIISHGSEGLISLGSTDLDKDQLESHMAEISEWGESLQSGADIFLYGCNVAEGDSGSAFVNLLANVTGAQVMASVDATGSSQMGGNWRLEYSTGVIESTPLFSGFVSSDFYNNLLQDVVIDGASGDNTFTIGANSVSGQSFSATDSVVVRGFGGDDTFKFSAMPVAGSFIVDGGAGTNTLDFSGINSNLTFTVQPDGSITVSGAGGTVNAQNIENIIGGGGQNRFVFENGSSFAGNIVGNSTGSSNTLDMSAYTTDLTWNITGADSGNVAGINFSGVGNLLGGTDNRDTFILSPAGSLSGGLDGGPGGFDTLVINGTYTNEVFNAYDSSSGLIQLDGKQISYSGLEPITDNTSATDRIFTFGSSNDNITLGYAAGTGTTISSGSSESVTFSSPSNSLTIDGGGGTNNVTFDSIDPSFAAKLIIENANLSYNLPSGTDLSIMNSVLVDGGNISASVEGNLNIAANVTISSRDIGASTDYLGGTSIGTSGDISLSATQISVGANTNILANVNLGSSYQAGDVNLNASADYESNWASITPFFKDNSATATVGISDGDVIKGNNVSIDTVSDSSKMADFVVDNDALPATINSLPSTSQNSGDAMYTGALTFVNRAGAGNGGALTFSDNSQAGTASVTFSDNSEAGNGGTLTFANNSTTSQNDTITRSVGSWLTDGFQKGNDIYITHAANPADNGYFTISDLTATVITLDKSGVLTSASDSAARFGLYDTITRNDGGDWTARASHKAVR